ncbi:MAG: aminotransferase class V-fold PLP-dependent enzyme [Sulfuriflexus sp.]|nr:aminotransferase class V-fold PLP-dependent enzyme [Sulfuriflexus sp.]
MNSDKEFPLDSAICYLNHAAVGPWPQRTRDRVVEFANENITRGAQHYPQWLEVEDSLRVQCSALLNAASADDIALVKNTSEALSMVAHGLEWQAGDNVVIPAGEFPSNRVVWESLAEYGVEVRQVDTRSIDEPEKALFEQFDSKTRLLSVSSVQYDIGLCLDLVKLGQYCRESEVLFCVDAIQSLGVLEMDVEAIQADFVMADGHKWLLGPEGLAIFYSRPSARRQLKLHEFGWHMLENLYDFDSPNWSIAESARRFECGSPNMLGTQALDASLSLFTEIGVQSISRNIFKNTSYLIDKLNNISGIEVQTPRKKSRHAGIVNFKIHDKDPTSIYESLMKQGVICALRGGGIRFSPHFYTSQAVLDKALDILSKELE